jgi:lysophospholipase L1-like esterase
LTIVPEIISGLDPAPLAPSTAARRAAGLPAGGMFVLGLGMGMGMGVALASPASGQSGGAQAPVPAPTATSQSAASQPAVAQAPVDLAKRFAERVAAYEAGDAATPPPTDAVLLAGDSQFDRWKTVREDLPGYTLINRGIDSFRTDDLIQYADRLIVAYKPRLVVLHVGGNDLTRGKTPEQLLADTQTLIAKIRAGLPGVKIAWSSTTPGPGRWEQAEKRKAANALVKAWAATQKDVVFIDLWDAMLTPDKQPREDLWVADRVHPNHAGYQIRARLTIPVLGAPDQKK